MTIRKVKTEDLPFIIKMLADDKLGSTREEYNDPLPEVYYEAFKRIDDDINQELVVGVNSDDEIVATLQLTFIQYLTYKGGIRAQIESVRVRTDSRGAGLGEKLFRWAIEQARTKKAHLIQLTSDKQRPEAIKFYENLGFKTSHEGMKLHL